MNSDEKDNDTDEIEADISRKMNMSDKIVTSNIGVNNTKQVVLNHYMDNHISNTIIHINSLDGSLIYVRNFHN